MTHDKLPALAPPAWGIGQVAVQIFRDVPSLLLLFYMTQQLAIPPALAGAAIFLPKLVFGVLFDLGVGALSDRIRAKVSRRLFLLVGAVLAPIALILLFTPPEATTVEAKAGHVTLILTFYMAVFALFSVPHLTIGAEMTRDPAQTSTVMAWRIAFSAVGLVLASSVAPILAQAQGYQAMATVLAVVAAASLAASFFGSPKQPAGGAGEAAPSLGAAWGAILANKPFVALYAAFFLQLTAAGMAYATWMYLMTFNLAFPEPLAAVGIIGLCISVCAMGAQPIWVMVSTRFGKRTSFLIGTLMYAAALGLFTLVPTANLPAAIACGVLMGLGNSGCYQSAFAMLADSVEDDRRRTGEAKGGLYSALWVINDKVAFALGGTLLAGVILSAFGFQAGQGVAQSAQALTGIAIAFAAIPVALNLAAFAVMFSAYRAPALTATQPAE
jgi:glycoside/pentoside/hexuronide:cation symporter, GPH family